MVRPRRAPPQAKPLTLPVSVANAGRRRTALNPAAAMTAHPAPRTGPRYCAVADTLLLGWLSAVVEPQFLNAVTT